MDDVFAAFPSCAYLEKYYSYVGEENTAWLRSIVDGVLRLRPDTDSVVEVGGGPVVAPIMALAMAAEVPRQVTFCDAVETNLDVVRSWVGRDPGSFDYMAIRKWLEDYAGVEAGENLAALRDATWQIERWDVDDPPPAAWRGRFDVVSSHFFAESATDRLPRMVTYLSRIAMLARPGATLLLSLMRRSRGYAVGGYEFPAVSVDEETLPQLLERAGIELEEAEYHTTGVEHPPTRPGYEGMVFLTARIVGVRRSDGRASRRSSPQPRRRLSPSARRRS